jgi:hypothetical protein
MITYFIRLHCAWLRVTTSRAAWLAVPRAVVLAGCRVAPLGVVAALSNGHQVLTSPDPSPAPDASFQIPPTWVDPVPAPVAMPEPSSLAVLAAGVVGVILLRRRRA